MPLRRVLRTRLLPPRLPAQCLPRRRLVDRARGGLAGRLLVVSAGAGYGKSTLMAQVVDGLDRPWAWISLDERVAEPTALMAHLAAALEGLYPGFAAGVTLEGPPEQQVRELCNEVVSTVSDDLVVVLDDAHVLRDPAAVEALDLLVHDLPPLVHLALVSRTEIPLPLSRLRPQGVLELAERDLALDDGEAEDLLGRVAGDLPAAERERLVRMAEGWVTGLLLAASGGGEIPAAAALGAEGHLIGYLAEEVLARLPEDTQEFLTETAVLERFTPAMATVVTGRDDAPLTVDALLAQHVFAVRLDAESGWMRYHHGFQSLLRARAGAWPPERRAAVHRRAGDAWRAAGDPGEAVRHYVAAGDLAAAVDVLEPVAERMISNPQDHALTAWLEAIPPELWSDSPGLVLARASALFARARFPEAFVALEGALDDLVEAGDGDRAAIALFRYLRALGIVGGQQHRVVRAGNRWLHRIDPHNPLVPACRILLAGTYAELGRHEEAADELRIAGYLATAAELPEVAAYGRAMRAFALDHPLGESADALAALDEAVAQLELHADRDDLNFLPYARAYRAIVLAEVGRFEQSLAEAERVRDETERRGLDRLALPVVAWMRFTALAGLERWAELGAELAWTAPVFARIGGAARGYRYHVAAARLAAATASPAAVARHVDSARAGLRSFGHPYEEALALAELSLAAADAGLTDQARDLALGAERAAAPTASPWARAAAALAGAVAWGEEPEGDAHLAVAVDAAAHPAVVALWSRRERGRVPALLARAMARDLGAPDAAVSVAATCGGEVLERCAELLADAGPEARARLAEAAGGTAAVVRRLLQDPDPDVRRVARRTRARAEARPRGPLRLVTLGGFAVWRNGVAVPDQAFERQKARALLAGLLCARGPVHREPLVEALWPNLPPDRGLAALHSTLYALRRALEPGLSRREPSSLVVAEGHTYRLVLSEGDEWDAAAFLALAARARSGRDGPGEVELLLEAEGGHAGPFLPEWPYAEWAEPLRTEVEEAHRGVLERLAAALAERGQPAAAIARYRRLLALEPEREGWHRALMRVYADAGERALALRQYHACRAVLRQRLAVEPSRETRVLYAALLKDEGGGPG